MSRPIGRVIPGLLIAPFLLFGLALAPVHVHESRAGHSHAVIHSHLEPHHLDAHEDAGPELEPDAERIVWLTSAILHTIPYHDDPAPAFIVARFDVVATTSARSAPSFANVARVHGPPRRHPWFRGPPLSLA